MLTKNPRQHVLLLAIVAMISDIAVQVIYLLGSASALLDWRVVAAIVFLGAAAGIVGLYLTACFLKWSATPLGGRASMTAIRAVLVWGGAPIAIAVPICLVVFIGLERTGVITGFQLIVALKAVVFILTLWTLLLVLLMFARVQSFGFWRTIVSFTIASFVLMPIIPLLIRTFLFQPFNTRAAR